MGGGAMIDPNTAAHGTPDAYREYIHEMLSLAQVQANLGTTYAAVGDDTGLEYALRRLVAYTRTAVAVLSDLKAMRGSGHAR
jgi:uncharacterized protein (DUF1800 family)